MPTQAFHYDHPNYITTRMISLGQCHAPTASVVQAAFHAPVAMRLHRIAATALIAGTTATNVYTVRQNTTSIGALTLNDSAALFSVTADLATSLTAGDELNLLKGTDATGVASFMLEYHVDVGAALSI